jgi:hypothetical protein
MHGSHTFLRVPNGNYRGEADPPPNQEQTEDDDSSKPCACSPGGGKGVWVNTLQNRVVATAPDERPSFTTPTGVLNFQALIPELMQDPNLNASFQPNFQVGFTTNQQDEHPGIYFDNAGNYLKQVPGASPKIYVKTTEGL